MRSKPSIPEEIEEYRDGRWCREATRQVETARDAERFIEQAGFAACLTDSRRPGPSLYVAVCGRRDAVMPRNVQKDPEASLTWVLKDELIGRSTVYYAKLAGRAMFLAPRMIPYFHAVWGVRRSEEPRRLSRTAQAILRVLRHEWEMSTADLRDESGVKNRTAFTKSLDELQAAMIVIPSAVYYQPKFTYIWTLGIGRFPDALRKRVNRDTALREIARGFLAGAGMTIPGELARVTGLSRPEAGRGNRALVAEGYATMLSPGWYQMATPPESNTVVLERTSEPELLTLEPELLNPRTPELLNPGRRATLTPAVPDSTRKTPEPADDRTNAISRREFGRTIGTVAVGGTVYSGAAAAFHGDNMADAASPSPQKPAEEITFLSAIELAARIRKKQISARDVMAAHLSQIERTNPKVNAIVTLVADRALADAARADEALARGGTIGVLHGLPVAHKDLVATAGIRTTRGSPFYRDQVPTEDATIIARIRAAGAVTLGKTNTPELGAGSQTFNTIFGATRNPYDLSKTCGGSSGGAAVALACGMVPIADGSDTGGSLRNPAAFCNVVGFRPSPGRVPRESSSWSPLSVSGPMARTVADLALFFSAIAGPDPRTTLSISEDGARFAAPLGRSFKGTRVAWWRGLGGMPFEPEIRSTIDAHRRTFETLGCVVEEAEPDFAGVDEAFPTLRYAANHAQYAALAREKPEWVKDTIKFEIAQAERLTGADVGRALARQARMYDETRQFFERYEYFVLPVTQVSPFDVNTPYPTRIGDAQMTTYIDWMRSCWYVTFMATPAISVPAGFTTGGLPIGIQIVGRHRADWSVLQLAHAFEQATGHGKRRPPIA